MSPINVPLYVFKTNNFSIPISLSYSSNGIKVDQLTTNVGLGWSLNAGGVISRIVRGKEDENYPVSYPVEEINKVHLAGISGGTTTQYTVPNSVDPDIVKYIYDAHEYGIQDTQTDLFSYNFMGQSGKIVRGHDSKIFTVPHSNLSIAFSVDNSKISIKTEDGVEYFFEDTEINNSTTKSNLIPGHNPPELGYKTAWFLTKMVHPKGEEVNFTYDSHDYTSVTKSQSLRLPVTYPYITSNGQGQPAFSPNKGVETNTTYSRIAGVILKKIASTNHGEIIFDNSIAHPTISGYKITDKITVKNSNNDLIEEFDFDYLTTNNNRVFLDKVKFNNPDKEYSFSYYLPNYLPGRYAYSQDYWGYYNGYTNQSLLPNLPTNTLFSQATNQLANKEPRHSYAKTGLLTKITYPTKGYTNFIYEANTYNFLATQGVNNSHVSTLLAEDTKTTTFTTPALNNNEKLESFKLYADVKKYTNGTNCGDYPEGKARIQVQIYDVPNNSFIYDDTFVNGVYPNQNIPDLLDNHQYQLIITNITFGSGGDDACVDAVATLKYTKETTSLQNIETGGNRIKATENYTEYNVKSDYKRYFYGKMNSLNVSSGDRINRYSGHVSSDIERLLIGGGGAYTIKELTYNTLRSSSNFPLFNSGSNNIYYKYVTVSHGNDTFLGGGQEYEYHLNRDAPAEVLLGDSNLMISNFSNTGWNHGLNKQIKTFKKDDSSSNLIIVNKSENIYTRDTLIADVSNYHIQKQFPFVGFQPADPTYVCKSEDLTKRTPIWQCQNTSHTHKIGESVLDQGFFGAFTFYSSGSKGPLTMGKIKCRTNEFFTDDNLIIRYHEHACYGKTVNFVASYPQKISNLNILKYKTLSYWHYLSKTVNTAYDINGNNPVINNSEYFYDNDYHLKRTRTEITNSKGEVLKTKYYYANEMINTTLINAHRIGEVLKTESFKDATLLSTQKTIYNTFNANYLPQKIQTLKGIYNSTTNKFEDRVIFHNYDNEGNPIEVSKKDGTKVYYVWGYYKTQPIAKIEGYSDAQLSAIQTKINTAIIASNNDTTPALETTLRTTLKAIRDDINMVNAQVTTFTYDPLIGVTSVTDPRGQTIYYHYDNFNRLQFVKDNEGKILGKTEYNYKN